MGRHERPIDEYWMILSELAHGGHLNYVFVEQVEVAARKIRKISIMTMVVTSIVSTSYIFLALFPLIIGGSSYARVSLLSGRALLPFHLFIVGLAIAFVYVGVAEYLFPSHLSQSIKGARAREKTLENEMVTQELV